ncbi:MAG TPA: hypothetical protein V6D25_05335 [Leptolyngbyaceae cyanobacterium]
MAWWLDWRNKTGDVAPENPATSKSLIARCELLAWYQLPLRLVNLVIRNKTVKNQDHETPLFSCKLSGVVTVADDHSTKAVGWKQRLISSFAQARFQNVLCRATVLPRVNWAWHSSGGMQLCEEAIAIIAQDTNDYRQILIRCNHLANTLQDLDASAALLLMISPGQDFAFGIDLTTGEFFSTHILLTQKKSTLNNCVPLPVRKVVNKIDWRNGRKIC